MACMLYINWTYDWNHLSYSSIFFHLVKIAASGWVYGLAFCYDEEPAAPPLNWGTVGALTCWSLAGIFPLVFSPSPPAGEVAAVHAGWPCAHADFGTGLDMQSFTWVLGSFSILPTPWTSPTCQFSDRGAFDLQLRIIFLSLLVRLWENVGYNYILKY